MNNVIEELMRLSIEEAQQRLTHLLRESPAELIMPNQWPITSGHTSWIDEVWLNYISNTDKPALRARLNAAAPSVLCCR